MKKGKQGEEEEDEEGEKEGREESVLVHITVSERPGPLPCKQSAEVQKVLPFMCYHPLKCCP